MAKLVNDANTINKKRIGDKFTVRGRIIGSKKLPDMSYHFVKDETGCIKTRQNHVQLQKEGRDVELKNGHIIEATGVVKKQKSGERYVDLTNIHVISKSNKSVPNGYMFKKKSNQFDLRHLQLMVDSNAMNLFKKRSKAIRRIRALMEDKDYLEVETPILLKRSYPSSAREFTTKLNRNKKTLFLRKTIEPKLKLLMSGGFEQIYELGKVFRNEGRSTKFSSEYTAMDVMKAYSDYQDMIKLAKEIFLEANKVFGHNIEDIPIISFHEYLEKHGISESTPIKEMNAFNKLISNETKPIIVHSFPKHTSPTAKEAKNGKGCEDFRFYAGGFDIMHGYTMETNIDKLKSIHTKQAENSHLDKSEIDTHFLESLEYGIPPVAGLGVGVDRMIQYLADKRSIKDTILYPL